MTQERFHRLLDNPELLTTLPYEELKTLVLTYPYAHNLRYLLALKARQDEHPDADRMLTSASFYSLDRTQLFLLTSVKVSLVQPVAVAMEEAVLELKPIELVQRELEARAPQQRTIQAEPPVAQPEIKIPPAPAARSTEPLADEPPPETGGADTPSGAIGPQTAAPDVPLEETPDSMVSDTVPTAVVAPTRQPFALWYGQFNPPALGGQPPPVAEAAAVEAEPEAEPPGPITAQALAERSVTENKDVISETLARLLIKQGYRDKAIAMYERLCLAIPEKSTYFAAEIEKLKK